MGHFSKPKSFWQCLIDPEYAKTALRVALIVGSILFAINHGIALWQGQMTQARWFSGLLTYLVPYLVSVHGQYANHTKQH
ncbi:MAG TPA: nitrate/nitrite transporter NrtS [Oscillatoriales cyanobacterium M4454_W2019_049]|nr:nitrate/nitrite transporter NrtS [Oscillatoriales cyanobacterium M4454_W2019_049]